MVGNEQYEQALPVFLEVIERSPKSFYAYIAYKGLVAAYQLSGRQTEAWWAAQTIVQMNPKFSIESETKLSPSKDGRSCGGLQKPTAMLV